MEIPDLNQLAADLKREEAESKAYVAKLALRNVATFLWLAAPFIPPELQRAFAGVQDDVDFARQVVRDGA